MLIIYLILVLSFDMKAQCKTPSDDDTHNYCHPASCADGSCYCTDKKDGWFNGGSTCQKYSKRCECGCFDVGTFCGNERCPDHYTSFEKYEGYQGRSWEFGSIGCYLDDPVEGRIETDLIWHDDCYRTKVMCDYVACPYGEHLVGCGRVSAGRCERCRELQAGHFWESKGSCVQRACTAAAAGHFVAKPCTSTSDAVVSGCSGYTGNKGSLVSRPDGRDTYYCPGGGLVLSLPENSQPTEDYSNFECLPGYHRSGTSCAPCMPGFACKHGRKYECPAHYYTSTSAMSHCTRCTRSCASKWQYPVRCAQGSTSNPGCVSCGACAFDPRRGMSCVMESYEMQGLSEFCNITNENVAVAVCQKV
jgi:hypothetical protein